MYTYLCVFRSQMVYYGYFTRFGGAKWTIRALMRRQRTSSEQSLRAGELHTGTWHEDLTLQAKQSVSEPLQQK